MLALGAGSASAGLVGSTVHPRFYGLDPATLDADAGIIQIAGGTSFTFADPFYGFGTFMQVTFSDTQITLTNLVAGVYPDSTAADFEFLSGPALASVTVDRSSSSLLAPGSILTFNSNRINLVLNNTCALCVSGESIVLDVTTAVPEPASAVLLGAGVLAMVLRRRKLN